MRRRVHRHQLTGRAFAPRLPLRVRPLAEAVNETERDAIAHALDALGGNLQRTADALGIERNTLKRKLRAFGLYPERYRAR